MNIGFALWGHNLFIHRAIAMSFVLISFLIKPNWEIPKTSIIWGIFASVFFAPYRLFFGTLDPKLLNFILSVIFAFCYAEYIVSLPKKERRRFLPFISICSIANDLFAIAIYVIALKTGFSFLNMVSTDINVNYFGYIRLAGLWGDPNHYALLAMTFSAFNLFNIETSVQKMPRIAYLLNCVTITLTFSRSGWLIFVILNILSFTHFRKTRKIIFGVFLFLVAVSALPLPREIITQRIESTYKTLGTSSSREVLWKKSLSTLLSLDSSVHTSNFEKWTIGSGVGSHYFLLEKEYGKPKVSHNTYIDFLIEHGIFGIFFLCMPFTALIYVTRLGNHRRKILGLSLILVIGGMGMFLSFSSSPLPFILFFLSYNFSIVRRFFIKKVPIKRIIKSNNT
jgi:hypothetical protein